MRKKFMNLGKCSYFFFISISLHATAYLFTFSFYIVCSIVGILIATVFVFVVIHFSCCYCKLRSVFCFSSLFYIICVCFLIYSVHSSQFKTHSLQLIMCFQISFEICYALYVDITWPFYTVIFFSILFFFVAYMARSAWK